MSKNNLRLEEKLISAAIGAYLLGVKKLIDNKADVNLVDYEGNTPLMRISNNSSYSDKEVLCEAAKELIKVWSKSLSRK